MYVECKIVRQHRKKKKKKKEAIDKSLQIEDECHISLRYISLVLKIYILENKTNIPM